MSEQELLGRTSAELQEELERARKAVDGYEQEYKDICDADILARFGEDAKAKKEELSGADVYVTQVKTALFRANQRETLGSLSQESLEALAMYYDSSNPDTPLTYTGQYAKEQVMTAFENQGIPANDESFSRIYEYYRFAADEVRAMQKQTKWQEDYAAASTTERGWMNVQTVLSAPVRGISAATEMINAGLGYQDENAPLNIYDSAFDMTRYSTTVRSATSESIAEATDDSKLASFAYNTVMSIGDNAMNLVTMGGMGTGGPLTSMAADAASQSAMGATLRGADKEDALRTGFASGSIELATEALPINRLLNIPSNSTLNSMWKGVTEQAVIEGTEELISAGANTAADYIINQNNSSYSQSITAYMEQGMSVEDAVLMANVDVMKQMGESALSGAVSGGTLSGGAYLANGIVMENTHSMLNTQDVAATGTLVADAVESTVEERSDDAGLKDATMEALEKETPDVGDATINENYTQSADGVIHYKADQSVEARGWQGGDKFPGKDTYKNVTLEGSLEPIYLVKLKFSKSGYFMLKSEYDALKDTDGLVDSQVLSQGVQVAPWYNKDTRKYEYQSSVSVFKLEKDLDVAMGEQTLANPQYGIGKMTQIYIAGYEYGNQANNESIGLKAESEECLKNSEITEEVFNQIGETNNQHVLKRNLFLQLALKDELTKVKQQTTDEGILAKCETAIESLDHGIYKSKKMLLESAKEIGVLESSTYDDISIYLEKKYTHGIDMDMETKITEVETDLLRQVNENIHKNSDDRSIEITEPILNVYEADLILAEVQQELRMDRIILEDDRLVLDFEEDCKISLDDEFKLELPDDSIDWGSIEITNPAKVKDVFTR